MRLLIEIGTEELPAIPFLRELKNIEPKWEAVLDKFALKSEFCFEFTPRRLVITHNNFSEFQPDSEVVMAGAPKSVALKDGEFTKAALSFANKCGISQSELEFREIDGKEVLYFKSIQKGKKSSEILPQMIDEFLNSLSFGKSMRWGTGEFEFIRPIRNLVCVLEDDNGRENIDFELYGVKSDMAFYPHRSFGYEKIPFNSIDEYFSLLEKNGVILNNQKRREKILSEFSLIEKKNGIKIQIDEDLLDEVVAITEYPSALLGEFESEYLAVPKEVIITSMKENQRYFAVFKDENLSNHFVVVSNAISSDSELIIKGNEKVLRARLSDAMFFYQNDLASEFSPEKLKNITYMGELGSVYEKSLREVEVAKKLYEIYKNSLSLDSDELLIRAIMLSKADLTTSMVGEFGELQGIIGEYYAKAKGEDERVCLSIGEQYLPSGEDSKLPSTIFSSIVALSIKLETLISLFSINKIPTGTKDPYALRRAALGLIKIVLNEDLNFDLKATIDSLKSNYKEFDSQKLISFIKDRLATLYCANSSIINSVLKSGENDIKKLNSAILALDEIALSSDFKDKFATFKRLANIIKDSKFSSVDENLLSQDAEINLYRAFKSLDLEVKDCKIYLNSLFDLKPNIDEFFDKVMINVDDEAIKNNRLALVGGIYTAFLKVADIKEISF